jgi:undecaprenyl-diphosphatase
VTEAVKAAILGLIQGVTEFFPISSSAHLRVFRDVLDLRVESLAFDVSVHLATLFAVFIYFRRDIARILRGPDLVPTGWRLLVGTIPSVAVGLLLKSSREGLSPWFVVGGWTFSAAYLLLSRGREGAGDYPRLSLRRVLGIGLAQSLAIFPGVSRSGSTISAGLWLGLTREAAARFSFFLAIPAILGACVLGGLDLVRSPGGHESLYAAAAVAMPFAFVSGLVAIHFLLRAVRSDRFHRFGWYNLVAAIAFAAYLLRQGSP